MQDFSDFQDLRHCKKLVYYHLILVKTQTRQTPHPRIALVTGGLPLGGSTTFILFLTAALRRLGVSVEVFSFSSDHPLAKEFANAGVPVHIENERKLIYEDRLQRIYSRLQDFNPTAVFAVLGAESFELLRYLPKWVARIGIFHDRGIQPHIFAPRYRATLDHLVVVAPYLREEILHLDPNYPCSYLAHGIPLPKGILPRSATKPSMPLRLLYYGRFENISKGVRLFPEIAAALKRRRIPFMWTFHGYGMEEEYLKTALADEIRAGQVIFSSPIPYKELPALIRHHDIYMLASTNEGGPLTLLESMALGLVPVCGDIPCLVQEVIKPDNGFRVPRANADAYAVAIKTLDADRNLLEQMSQSARATIIDDFSDESMARRYLAFLESLHLPASSAVWPQKIQARPILGGDWLLQLQQLAPFRGIRRLVKRLRK